MRSCLAIVMSPLAGDVHQAVAFADAAWQDCEVIAHVMMVIGVHAMLVIHRRRKKILAAEERQHGNRVFDNTLALHLCNRMVDERRIWAVHLRAVGVIDRDAEDRAWNGAVRVIVNARCEGLAGGKLLSDRTSTVTKFDVSD